ncbi:MAG: alpha/beta hydrolase [Ardenticatenaceae bacterium]
MIRKILLGVVVLLVVLGILFFAGPRVEVDTTLHPVELPQDLDAYLRESEAKFSDIVPGAEKTIIWAGEPGQKTPLSIVYLHGFSATRQETAPLSDNLAAKLGANLYYPRVTGHGRSGAAMAETTVNDWINDSHEALSIAQKLGEQVIVIGVSTGGTAATWLSTQPDREDVLAFVLISPNFAPRDPSAEIIIGPWGEQIATMLIGPERSWEPINEQQGKYWTHRYPTKAVLPMIAFVKVVREMELEAVKQPLLVIYSPNDQVINPTMVEETFARFGSANKKLIPIEEPQASDNHVLAGDIVAANDTPQIEKMILDFVSSLIGQ